MNNATTHAFRARAGGSPAAKSILALAVIGVCWCAAPAAATPILGSDLASFTVLGASAVTNVPTSTIVGNVGVWPTNAITGFNHSPGVAVSDTQVTGTVQEGTTTAQLAQAQLTTAITNLGSLGPGTTEPADLAGLTLPPGIYTVPAGTTNLSAGTLTLNGNGNANAAWVFLMPSTLITSSNTVVQVINTGSGAGVYWDVGSSATIGTNTTFLGNILATAAITMNTGATDLCGRALASTAAVTLQQNSLSGTCSGLPAGSGGQSAGLSGGLEVNGSGQVSVLPYASATVPEPATLSLLFLGLAGIGFVRTRRQKTGAA